MLTAVWSHRPPNSTLIWSVYVSRKTCHNKNKTHAVKSFFFVFQNLCTIFFSLLFFPLCFLTELRFGITHLKRECGTKTSCRSLMLSLIELQKWFLYKTEFCPICPPSLTLEGTMMMMWDLNLMSTYCMSKLIFVLKISFYVSVWI